MVKICQPDGWALCNLVVTRHVFILCESAAGMVRVDGQFVCLSVWFQASLARYNDLRLYPILIIVGFWCGNESRHWGLLWKRSAFFVTWILLHHSRLPVGVTLSQLNVSQFGLFLFIITTSARRNGIRSFTFITKEMVMKRKYVENCWSFRLVLVFLLAVLLYQDP